jgi:hypothetical protein
MSSFLRPGPVGVAMGSRVWSGSGTRLPQTTIWKGDIGKGARSEERVERMGKRKVRREMEIAGSRKCEDKTLLNCKEAKKQRGETSVRQALVSAASIWALGNRSEGEVRKLQFYRIEPDKFRGPGFKETKGSTFASSFLRS